VISPIGPTSENSSSSKLNTAAVSLEVIFTTPEWLLMLASFTGIEWDLFAFINVMAKLVQALFLPQCEYR
jgi:hypothetical protein